MNLDPVVLALGAFVLALVSNWILKRVSTAVPVIVIGLPVIHGGLGAIIAVGILTALSAGPQVVAFGALAAMVGSFWCGCRLASRYFKEGMTGNK